MRPRRNDAETAEQRAEIERWRRIAAKTDKAEEERSDLRAKIAITVIGRCSAPGWDLEWQREWGRRWFEDFTHSDRMFLTLAHARAATEPPSDYLRGILEHLAAHGDIDLPLDRFVQSYRSAEAQGKPRW